MQKLMGTAAMLIDWFRFCILQGYLPSELARPGTLEERNSRRIRRGKGLNLPYGPVAEKLRLAAEGPWAPDPPPDERPFSHATPTRKLTSNAAGGDDPRAAFARWAPPTAC